MKLPPLINDQPANLANDSLQFQRCLEAIDRLVLQREDTAPLTVGIHGPWGSGKTTMLEMIAEQLTAQRAETYKQPVTYRFYWQRFRGQGITPPKWLGRSWLGRKTLRLIRMRPDETEWSVVRFSPWRYRGANAMLPALLAQISLELRPVRWALLQLLRLSPQASKELAGAGFKTAGTIWRIAGMFHQFLELRKPQDLPGRIRDALAKSLPGKRRLALLIDDLDRCDDPEQVTALLEHLKLLLDAEKCVYFIAADRGQIVRAIEKKYPGAGERYLDKFIQVAFVLPAHRGAELADMLGATDENDPQLRGCLERIAAMLDNNPRQLKRLYNQARLQLEIVREAMQHKDAIKHDPSIALALKAQLLMRLPEIAANPHAYLLYEKRNKPFLPESALKNEDGSYRSEYHAGLQAYLELTRETHRFENARVVTLYFKTRSDDKGFSRDRIERAARQARPLIMEDYYNIDLSGGLFRGAVFEECELEKAILRDAVLESARFDRCNLTDATLQNARLEGAQWIDCEGMDRLIVEPELYEKIAESCAAAWHDRGTEKWEHAEELYKMYARIIEQYEEAGAPEKGEALREKARAIRAEVMRALGYA